MLPVLRPVPSRGPHCRMRDFYANRATLTCANGILGYTLPTNSRSSDEEVNSSGKSENEYSGGDAGRVKRRARQTTSTLDLRLARIVRRLERMQFTDEEKQQLVGLTLYNLTVITKGCRDEQKAALLQKATFFQAIEGDHSNDSVD
jgi:hypothetical protein